MRRLATQNLAEEWPSRLVEMLFYSHPSVAARLEAARVWESVRTESPGTLVRHTTPGWGIAAAFWRHPTAYSPRGVPPGGWLRCSLFKYGQSLLSKFAHKKVG